MNDTSYELFAIGFTIHMFIVNTKHIRDFVVSILKVLSRWKFLDSLSSLLRSREVEGTYGLPNPSWSLHCKSFFVLRNIETMEIKI